MWAVCTEASLYNFEPKQPSSPPHRLGARRRHLWPRRGRKGNSFHHCKWAAEPPRTELKSPHEPWLLRKLCQVRQGQREKGSSCSCWCRTRAPAFSQFSTSAAHENHLGKYQVHASRHRSHLCPQIQPPGMKPLAFGAAR